MKRHTGLCRCVKVALPLIAGVLLLSSCIDVNESVTMNPDGSGVVDLSYRIARMMNDLHTQTGSNQLLPLPTDPTVLQQALQSAPNLTLMSFTPEQTSQDVGANLKVQFADVSSLDQALGNFGYGGATYLSASGLATFTQTLYPGNPNGVSPETLQLVKQLFSSYRLSFTLKAPRRIRVVNIGSISSDGTTATYSTTVPDIIQSTTAVVWEVSW